MLPASLALWVPLLVMIASDLLIGPHSLFWLVWGCFFLVSVIGIAIRPAISGSASGGKDTGLGKIFLATIAGSVLFFVLTNLGVFLFQNMYAKNMAGLIDCYIMALPFFRNSVLGDLFFSFCLFGVFFLAKSILKRSAKPGPLL
jgi:hypothetical protein